MHRPLRANRGGLRRRLRGSLAVAIRLLVLRLRRAARPARHRGMGQWRRPQFRHDRVRQEPWFAALEGVNVRGSRRLVVIRPRAFRPRFVSATTDALCGEWSQACDEALGTRDPSTFGAPGQDVAPRGLTIVLRRAPIVPVAITRSFLDATCRWASHSMFGGWVPRVGSIPTRRNVVLDGPRRLTSGGTHTDDTAIAG